MAEPPVESCLHGLCRYAQALHALLSSLEAHAPGCLPAELRQRLSDIRGLLTCSHCLASERSMAPRVPAALREVETRLEQPAHACHAALRTTLRARLGPPGPEPEPLEVAQLRFSHDRHSETFRHGEHAGLAINHVVHLLETGDISPQHPSMVLNVVPFHGRYWAINNRHAVALVRYASRVQPRRADVPVLCYVRVWPLVPGLLFDDPTSARVMDKFLDAFSTATVGRSIVSRSPSRRRAFNKTRVQERSHVHISNIDFEVGEDELEAHLMKAGLDRPLCVTISRRKNGKSNGHARVAFASLQCAERAVASDLGPLRNRVLKVQLDTATQAAVAHPAEGSEGWVLCKQCGSRCASLTDAVLVEDVRQPWDDVPEDQYERKRGYFCLVPEGALQNCRTEPFCHIDETKKMSFKLKEVLCVACGSPLGNVQDATVMEGGWSRLCGEHAVNFKCAQVVLELNGGGPQRVEVRKWSILGEALGSDPLYRLSELSVGRLVQLLRTRLRNSGKEIRLAPSPAGH